MRNRMLLLPLGFTLAATLASCTDTSQMPTEVASAEYVRAVHDGLPTPSPITTSVNGDAVLLAWQWSDDIDWQFVTFSIYVDGTREIDGGKVRPYLAPFVYSASWTDYDVAAGSHLYCVKVMAKSKAAKRSPTTTYHSSACAAAVVL